jgi:hypothetical protein
LVRLCVHHTGAAGPARQRAEDTRIRLQWRR